jgi:hypothetical protein
MANPTFSMDALYPRPSYLRVPDRIVDVRSGNDITGQPPSGPIIRFLTDPLSKWSVDSSLAVNLLAEEFFSAALGGLGGLVADSEVVSP